MMNTYANEKRWTLFGCNVFFFIAVFLPLFEIDLLITSASMSTWNVISGGFRVLMTFVNAGVGTLAGLLAVLLLVIPIVHCLKLIGVFGERFRDSADVSTILSFAEIIALLGLPLVLLFSDIDDVELSDILNVISVVFYIWLVVAIVAVVLSIRLEPLPVDQVVAFRYNTTETCPACGAQTAQGSVFCWNCGTRVEHKPVFTGVFCQSCGTQNSDDAVFCSSCGERIMRPLTNNEGINT
ncbi:MAG: zinc ribbon domain-containing protein [Lachnospiraceae bacterium]|nr:zinc ribbon domain-containing protein [Lachnospiraceae bacterium]